MVEYARTDALEELLRLDVLNSFETDAGIFDCGNKQSFLSKIFKVKIGKTSSHVRGH